MDPIIALAAITTLALFIYPKENIVSITDYAHLGHNATNCDDWCRGCASCWCHRPEVEETTTPLPFGLTGEAEQITREAMVTGSGIQYPRTSPWVKRNDDYAQLPRARGSQYEG